MKQIKNVLNTILKNTVNEIETEKIINKCIGIIMKVVTILICYILISEVILSLNLTWIPTKITEFLQKDISKLFYKIINIVITSFVLLIIFLLLLFVYQLNVQLKSKETLMRGYPIWICYKYDSSTKDSVVAVRNILDKVFNSYKKKKIIIFGEFPECYIIYGSANKTALDTSGKRKDAVLKEHMQIRLKNTGTQCVKFNIENVRINGDSIETINPSTFFLCDLSKEKQEYIISINEVCTNDKDFENKFTLPENETILLFDIISYDLFKNKYLQTLNFSKKKNKWEFFIVDNKQI